MKKIKGNPQRPRLAVFRSNRHLYAQVIDDQNQKTLFACSTLDPSIKPLITTGQNCKAARLVGEQLGKALIQHNLINVVFDRRFRPYHGRIQAFADGARKMGLQF
jgi:large subunit ribosomal protein L18|uniref:Large ribosomal subunit protein uL18c n=1 Tax=Microchloropsis salina TaxID=2511165 RepID=T1RJC7_9STRA|nr:ribosomal protein L18 [Microchloropsis salina]AGI99131.1 ribosomal protein L18 [Microchloropsis salina]AHX25557.1 50S ribosomal protein L18 [Microchloropsis salina]